MILLSIYSLFYYQYIVYLEKCYMMGMRENPWNIQKTKQRKKKFPVWLPSHPPVYEVEADCFPASENTEKSQTYPKWERIPNLMGQKKTGLGVVWAVNGW